MPFTVLILVKLKFPQWYYIKTSSSSFLQNRIRIVEITGINLFNLLSKLCHWAEFPENQIFSTTFCNYCPEFYENPTNVLVPDTRLQTEGRKLSPPKTFLSKRNLMKMIPNNFKLFKINMWCCIYPCICCWITYKVFFMFALCFQFLLLLK
jgi:hypothetical protein